MMLNFQSLKFQIVALGVVVITIGILVRQFIALPLVQEHVRELAATQQLSMATYVARDVDYSIATRRDLIERFAADLPPELAKQPEKLQAWVKDRQRINPMFNSGLMAVRPDGNGLLAEYPTVTGRSQLGYAASDWFLGALRGSKAVIGKPFRGRANGDPIIIFAAPVRDSAGSIVTVLAGVAQLDAPGFLDRLQETPLGVTGGFLLISPADQLFVASSNPDMILKPTPRTGMDLLHDRAMSGYRGTGVTINANGVEELSAMVTVPSTGWFVVARMPTEEAFRPVTALRGFVATATTVLMVLIITILLIALPRILRPLTDTARAILDMAEGKSKLAPLPIVRDDEVGKLVSGFNYLVDRLSQEEAAREASETRLKYLAHHDSLTGLYNRAMLEERLAHAMTRTERDGTQIALLFCDLDGFKPVNDQYGHDTGDAVLRQVARRLTDGRRRIDTVARLGGDEFVILLTALDDARGGANSVAQQCLAALREPFEIEGKSITLGVSIGIAVHAGPAVAASYLIAQADIAMYQVKRKGKGNFFFMDTISAIDAEQHVG
ncbi:GGDEF domain-containing protein [Noviherbaspirillum sedimenti]|uniref:Diguanylate cyclase n=1 Tax=Noviherbaspirillum sedimenti TaxID=2320865 RepID=A0A3A3FW45_9BURK|nr:GGDEF domain-containing protein [Noviherbaspirillum sedimenti]RJG00418.1 diguanylate cyclase [Noviherbaspirillum sedimenti]